MRQTHPAGERMFVAYAGQTVKVIDGATGEVSLCEREIFVERLPKVTTAHSRRSCRLVEIQRHIGMALGGVSTITLFGGPAITEFDGLPASTSRQL